MQEFLAAEAPCFALGMVEERQQLPAFCATKGLFIKADKAPKRTPARSIFLS
jgi:hypothetical protein